MRRIHIVAGALAVCLAGCNDSNRASTVSAIATQQIQSSTTETNEPLELNERRISDRDTSESTNPRPL